MSILIKGIDMPKECKGIELVFIPKDGDIIYNSESMSIGAEQIVEIPTPHGRLIDEDALIDIVMCKDCNRSATDDGGNTFCMWLGALRQPTDFCSYGEREGE